MAICFYNEFGQGKLALWEMTEEPDILLRLVELQEEEIAEYSQITNLRRQKEWLSTRALLREMIGQKAIIEYSHDGKPFIKGSSDNISISHTGKFVAILIHPYNSPGIDIEEKGRQVEKVAKRFLSSDELDFCNSNIAPGKVMLVHWCAKEAVFKMIPDSNINFSKQIHLKMDHEIAESGGSFNGVFLGEDNHEIPFILNCFFFDPLIVVWGWV